MGSQAGQHALQGGLIVTPCGSDLRLISIGPGGSASQTVLSQVRYSDLEVWNIPSVTIIYMSLEYGQATESCIWRNYRAVLLTVESAVQACQKLHACTFAMLQLLHSRLAQVPSDAQIVAAMVADGRAVRVTPPPSPSSFAADCAAILGPNGTPRGGGGGSFGSGRRRSSDSDCSAVTPRALRGACSMGHASSG